MVLDQSLAHSLPARTAYRRASFDLPTLSSRPAPSNTPPSHRLHHRRAHPSDPTYNAIRFRDDELLDLHSDAFVPTQYTGKGRQGILLWARSVHPGLEEDLLSSSTLDPSTSIPADLDKLARPPFFPLTAQNLAPPCVTVNPRHLSLDYPFSRSKVEQRTAPSLIQSQDDSSLLTPATESVNTPSVPDASPASSYPRPILGRFVSKISSWISPTRIPPEGRSSLPSQDEDLVHSDETLRVHISGYQEKSSAVQIPQSQIRHPRRTSFVDSEVSDSDAA